ncbi:dehydrogenase [Aureimonas sp. SA4125]|uniref:zinc-dependent alcohol dehydrogenase n=1 Tax=Aureimonas sp. SA4125 TaxID=2826993 RepID=UPI001CC73A66|nr:alcohol dehydrogenase catalytic domain-containing protein [Aureimonas sp. SA4125]BDA85165.1 dehydrogenase [Aureimonas sp. SA4125]
MRAARLHAACDIRAEEIPAPPAPGPGEVLLAVEAAGICGSDLHNFRTGQWISRAPSVAGHELAGRVIAVGTGVENFAPGDRVVADSRVWCGACGPCRSGRQQFCENLGFVGEVCDGGFAERVLLPARLLHAVDAGLDPSIAALAEPLAVALHAVLRLSPAPGAAVLVAGCGPIGGLVALLLSLRHDGPILIAERHAGRAALVAEVTGARIVTLDAESISAALGGRPLMAAVDATGQIPVLTALLETVAGGGRIALVGIFHAKLDLDPNRLVERGIALFGCHAFADEMAEAAALLPELAPRLRRFVAEEIAIGAVPEAYARLLAGQGAGLKTIVRPALS